MSEGLVQRRPTPILIQKIEAHDYGRGMFVAQLGATKAEAADLDNNYMRRLEHAARRDADIVSAMLHGLMQSQQEGANEGNPNHDQMPASR